MPASQFARGERSFAIFSPSKTVRAGPVFAKSFDGDLRGLAYAVKTGFVRRISLPRQPLADGSVTRRNTRDRPLLGRQRVELALALDRVGLGARIFLHGLRIVKTRRQCADRQNRSDQTTYLRTTRNAPPVTKGRRKVDNDARGTAARRAT